MSDDIVERLRDFAVVLVAEREPWHRHVAVVAEAATLIEQQRAMIANWEAAWAVQRGSVAASWGDSERSIITPAEPNTPR